MIDAFVEGLFLVLQWKAFAFMLFGITLGFWVGLLPGLGGATTLALMLPFIYTMQPVEAFAFLLGMHSVVATTGDITSILFGVPGESTTAAIILDGHAMAKKGEAGRALGAALASSLIGAIIGAFARPSFSCSPWSASPSSPPSARRAGAAWCAAFSPAASA
jgi:TctA family transporter